MNDNLGLQDGLEEPRVGEDDADNFVVAGVLWPAELEHELSSAGMGMPATSSLCLRPLPSCPCADAGTPDLLGGNTGLSGVTVTDAEVEKKIS